MSNAVKTKKGSAFAATLQEHDLELHRDRTTILQVNVGLRCDLVCKHCHLEAGPHRSEMMTRQTMDDVIAFAARCAFEVIDITGGAPELVPDLAYLLEQLAPLTRKMILRTNLTAVNDAPREQLLAQCRRLKVALVASFPSTNAAQADNQRGAGVHQRGVETLRYLNRLGYGMPGSDLELDLVANPSGAFLPTGQVQQEARFKRELLNKYGIEFNRLFTFANMPLGRFRSWLERSGNAEQYLQKLATQFNIAAVEGLMCRSLISVAWDGFLFDCDFNQAAGIGWQGKRVHVTEVMTPPEPGTPIMSDEHCYACTAGSGFT